jgi:hypothetical protein
MNEIKRLAIKYFILVIIGYIMQNILDVIPSYFVPDHISQYYDLFTKIVVSYSYLIVNLFIGTFILIDCSKSVRNKFAIPILAFILPIGGICFLLIEKYYLERIKPYGK